MALKESALTQVQEAMAPDISLPDAQRLWLQAHTPAVTRSRITTSTSDQWAEPAFTWSHPVPCHSSHGQSTGVSRALMSWQAPTQGTQYRRSGCGHQLQLSTQLLQRIVAAKTGAWQRVTQDWSQICPNGAVWRVWRGNATLFPSSESSSSISGYGTTPLCRAHPRQSRDRHTPDPAQLLLQLQWESSRVGAGDPSRLEGPFPLAPTKQPPQHIHSFSV